MIKADWNKFNAKFSENPQNNFEWFCYLLFCEEFNKPYGIFRYKNQAAIETNPVHVSRDIIGWQAKFFDSALSNHKGVLLETIKKAKKYYTGITKLIIYSNQEWGQAKGKTPSGLTEIESEAKRLNIQLDWRTTSFFESSFVSSDNEHISRHFFSLDNSIFDFIEDQRSHADSIFTEIRSSISYQGNSIEIDRSENIGQLCRLSDQVVVLSGAGGTGKTALVKEFYNKLIDQVPIYLFKSTEFGLRYVNDLFRGCDLKGFVEFHRNENKKVVIIDSAEKLLDIRNADPFKELLSNLLRNNWTIIFTTRDSYLEDLNYQFSHIYQVQLLNIPLTCLNSKELGDLSERYSFNLPSDERLLELIRVPFYLNEYLKYYKEESLDHLSFRNTLWNREIVKAKPAREQCFLKIAFERANDGGFFVNPDCESRILDDELKGDGILGYETAAGYFITHDIYEEWALEKIIEASYVKMIDDSDFFARIGQSLPIRRSFRSWLSYKLSINEESIFVFIERAIQNNVIEPFWKDEIIVSILLSKQAEIFFKKFSEQLLDHDYELLKKMTFLLRLACKEVDSSLLRGLGINNPELVSMGYMFTRPKGEGWSSLIKFVLDNFSEIGPDNIQFVLPAIHEWTKSIKAGQTTRNAGLIALRYYEWCIKEDVYFRRGDYRDKLFESIVNSVSEISNELARIFDDIVKNKWIDHRAPYYDLTEFILTKMDGVAVAKVLPRQILKLLDLYWYKEPRESHSSHDAFSREVESKFCLSKNVHFDYFPASAFQTPIYWLLQSSFKETIDFIIAFTNKTVEFYAQSGFDNVTEVSVFISDDEIVKQHHSPALWGMYRGTSSPVTPYLMQSVHMALEKFLLEVFEKVDSKDIQCWLIYLLRNSRSSSISAVVASVVQAYPEKTFDVAAILFRSKEFIHDDLSRKLQEYSAKMLYSMGSGLGAKNDVFHKERIKTCDDKHRDMALEHLFLNYQFFRSEDVSEQEADRRQSILWSILDAYYDELPDESEQTEQDKVWRLFLARMDRRKMNPTTETKDDGVVINFNPELEPNLKAFSEASLQDVDERSKYLALQLWAENKWDKDDRYKQYEKYDSDPLQALSEVEEIIEQLSAEETEGAFHLFNASLPAKVCSVLLRDNINDLDEEKREVCKTVALEAASLCFQEGYYYQIGDGVKQAFSVFPKILKEFPDERETIKVGILIALLMERDEFAIDAIHNGLWESNWDDANSLLLGYLWMKPTYDSLHENIKEENFKKGEYGVQAFEVIESFLASNENDVLKVIENKLPSNLLISFDTLRRRTLTTALQALPVEINDPSHKELVQKIVAAFISRQLSREDSNNNDHEHKHEFLEKYVWIVLKAKEEDVQYLLQPFIDAFSHSELFADLIYEFVIAEDRAEAYDNFWIVWRLLKPKVLDVASTQSWRADKMVKCFLFAQFPWNDSAKNWHSLKEANKSFVAEMAKQLGHHPATLYAISKLLNDIGSSYLDSGVSWVSEMLASNEELLTIELKVNTVYYLENVARTFIYLNREKVKRTKKIKEEVLVILNFLVTKGSVTGYMLRESIL